VRLYQVEDCGDWGEGRVEVVVAPTMREARRRGCGLDYERRSDLSWTVILGDDGRPVEVDAPDGCDPWTTMATARVLRDLLYRYGLPEDEARCVDCYREAWLGWAQAPAEWAVCPECERCLECASSVRDRCSACGGGR